ncbi:MAG TPA: M50 family metallopeptidase [Clostridia bacterium]|nr:M50 family metallopeptidase [Clostridia bacterium]
MFLSFVSSLSFVWGKAWPILIALLFFGVVIMVHELGHFSFAKLFNVKINEFSLGMGPALFKKQKGETKYALRLFPIGGYVNMEGEDEESDDERAFCKKPVWQRFIIVAMGATINLILGFAIVSILLTQTDLIGTPNIRGFYEGASSNVQGLQEDDKILEINNKVVYSEFDITFLMMRQKDGIMDFTVERDGEKVKLTDIEFETKQIDGNNVIIYDFYIKGVEPTFVNVIKNGFLETASMGRMVWVSLFDIVTGQFGLSDISGPIGVVGYIAEAAGVSTEKDFTPILTLMALITINIGIFNLLPVPALDGGRLFFMLIEMVRRKPVPAKYENYIHAVGLVILLTFMAVISMSDIVNLIRG